MLEWMILPFKRYADFSGRSRRKEFWGFTLLNIIVSTVGIAIMLGGGISLEAFSNPDAVPPTPGPIFFIGAGLLGIYTLAAFIPNLAVTVRRLHDRDMSGWFLLGYFVLQMIPIVNFVAGIAFIVIMFLEGTKGPNKFGPDPKDPTSADVFA